MERIAVFPGSFDPITIGHYALINRALPLFDEIVVAIGVNAEKAGFFPVEKRASWIRELFSANSKVRTEIYEGLTINFCKNLGASFIIRGLRTSADFEFERSVGQVNKKLSPEIETVFLLTAPEHSFISSSIVREILRHGGNPVELLPPGLILR
jgi:pantetheine-phosphate adenylyltransferase